MIYLDRLLDHCVDAAVPSTPYHRDIRAGSGTPLSSSLVSLLGNCGVVVECSWTCVERQINHCSSVPEHVCPARPRTKEVRLRTPVLKQVLWAVQLPLLEKHICDGPRRCSQMFLQSDTLEQHGGHHEVRTGTQLHPHCPGVDT